jgi:hypothetical protein
VGVGLISGDRPFAHGFFPTAAAAAESSIEERGSMDLSPGVVVDLAAERLFLMNPQGGIDAIGLASGNLLWTSKAAGKPLAVFDDRLAAQAEAVGGSNSIPIVLLDTKSGRVISSVAIPMAAGGMRPSIDDGMAAASSVQARVVPGAPSSYRSFDGLLVSWTVTGRSVSPIPKPENVRNDSGAALINLQTNQVTALAPDRADAMLRGKTSGATPRLSGVEGAYFPPRRVNGLFVSVKLGAASAGQHAVMKRWSETGEALPDIELGAGFVAYAISADQSLLLVISGPSGGRYDWSLYTIASGQRVGEVRLPESSAQAFFVWHSILIYRATGLHAVDLKTGTEMWTRALRDTSYHGPYLPHS